MTAVPLLELHGITKRFGALTALSDLSFHIGEGEVIGLLGDNGAGKSTTVNLISGIHKPTSGHLAVDGKQTLFTCRTDSAEAGIETIYQNTALVDDLSITRNIFMGRERTNALGFLRESEMREIAMDVLKSAVHISGIDSPDKLVGDLSGGQVLKLKSENVSSVLVTHNIYHAYQVCDRFVIMSHGTKVFDVAKADTDIAQLTEYVVLT